MISLQGYVALFARADLRRTFVLSILGRLPIGLTGLAILLLVQISTGSFARGGAAAACYVVGLAAIAPALGRVIDRYGPRRILVASGVLFPSALIALAAAVAHAPFLTLVFAAAAGATFSTDHRLRTHVLPKASWRRSAARRGVLRGIIPD